MPRPQRSDSSRRLTRREFVKTSAAATAVPLAVARFAHAAGSDEIKVGLIGCGGRGTGAAAQAVNTGPGVVVTALADIFRNRIEGAGGRLAQIAPDQVRVPVAQRYAGFDAARKVIESDVDVVILATPPHFRPAHLAAAVSAGKHVFCEKPMAVDSTGVRSVLATTEAARAAGLSLVAGFCWRYSSPERAVYQRLLDGAIGDIVSMHTTYHASPLNTYPRQPEWSDMEWQLRNWWHFRWLSGDHIVEQACHSVDKINWAMGGRTPLRAIGIGGRQMREGPESGNVYDHFTVVYEYENDVRCFHTCRQMPGCDYDNTEQIMGTDGRCLINGWGPTQVIKGARPWAYEGETPNMYQVELDELIASIRSSAPINDGTWMAHSTLMSIMGRMSAYAGRPVTWQEAMESEERWGPSEYAMGDVPVDPVAMPGQYTISPPSEGTPA